MKAKIQIKSLEGEVLKEFTLVETKKGLQEVESGKIYPTKSFEVFNEIYSSLISIQGKEARIELVEENKPTEPPYQLDVNGEKKFY